MRYNRSTKCGLKFSNEGKLEILRTIFLEYGLLVNRYIDLFWEVTPDKVDLVKSVLNSVGETWFSQRAKQGAAREAIDLISQSKETNGSKPQHSGKSFKTTSMLASLQIKEQASTFDCWLHLHAIGTHPTIGPIKLDLPIKLHKHYHKWAALGKRCESYILTEKSVQLCFEVESGPKLAPTRCIGVDTGIKSLASISTGHQFGRDIESCVNRVKRCKQGSKGQRVARRAMKHRMDEVAVELFDTLDPTLVVAERLRGLNRSTRLRRRLNKNMRRTIGSWAYRYWLGRLERECEVRRSSFRSVNPYKTSQRCSACGHTDRSNRSGEVFLCKKCGHSENADINAGSNILDRFLTGPYGAGCLSLPKLVC